MIHEQSFSRTSYLLTICFCFFFVRGISQDSSAENPIIYYRITLGGGLGKGYPQNYSETGIGGTFKIAVQRKKSLYTLSTTAVGEIALFDNSNVNNNISSIEVMYGKVLSTNKFFCNISGGLGFIRSQEKGAFISREGFWLFGYYNYEKINKSTIGIPISFQTFWIPTKFYGVGLDFYANINANNSFYVVSFCHQFGKLRTSLKRKKEKF